MTDFSQKFHWLGVDLTVLMDCEAAAKAVQALIGQHNVPVNTDGTQRGLRCTVRKAGTGWDLLWESGAEKHCATIAQLLVRLEYQWFMAIQHRHAGEVLFIHASAIQLEGRQFLIAGGPDSGKTTLALTAHEQGHRLIGDELIAVNISNWTMTGLQRGLKLNQIYPGASQLDHATHLLPSASLRWTELAWHRLDQLIVLDPALAPDPQIIEPARAAQTIYPHCLNSLSFTNGGMRHVIGLTQSAPTALIGRSAPENMIAALAMLETDQSR